jgi:hypothetical protein
MNIAFPALFIFALALPGIILRSSYREWFWKISVYPLPLAEVMAKSVFGAALLHVAGCGLAEIFGYRVNFSNVLVLLTGGFGLPPDVLKDRLVAITKHPGAIATYFSSIYAGAAAIGFAGHKLVRSLGLDLRWWTLRFDNFWYYVLTGEYVYFSENRASFAHLLEKPKIFVAPIIIVSCVVTHGSQSFIYYGFPWEHYYDQSGNLERILLKGVTYQELLTPQEEARRSRAAERVTKAGHSASSHIFSERLPIVGDFFILKGSDIHNLSVEYVFLTEQAEPAPAAKSSTPEKPAVLEPAPNVTEEKTVARSEQEPPQSRFVFLPPPESGTTPPKH